MSIIDPGGGIGSGGIIIGQPFPPETTDPVPEIPSGVRLTKLGVYGGPITWRSPFPVPFEVVLREVANATERITYRLTGVLQAIPPIRETALATERVIATLVVAYPTTIRETATVTERITASSVGFFGTSLREMALASDASQSGGSLADFQVPYGPAMAILTHIYDFFGPGKDWAFSDKSRTAPAHGHAGRVILWGNSVREIPIPAGPPRLGRLTIEFDDTPDPITGIQFFRSEFGARTPEGKRVDLKIGPSDGKEHLFLTPAAGVIEHATFPPGRMILEVPDVRYNWLQKPMPGLINDRNFPDLPPGVKEVFAPWVLGTVSSVGFGEQGAIRLTHVDTAFHHYLVARHPVESVTVYRKTFDEAEFTEVVSGWTLIHAEITIDGLDYVFSYVEFDSDQAGAEIRADVVGLPDFPIWGTVPPVTGGSDNVIDHAMAILYYVDALEAGFIRTMDVAFETFDLQSFATVRQQFEDAGYLAAYAITEPLTPEVILTQMFSTFLIHWFPSRIDKTKVVMTTAETPEDAPIFGDFHSILKTSETVELARETRNRIQYKFGKLYSDRQWAGSEVYNNEGDQAVLIDSNGKPIIKAEDVEFHACRDADVAELLAIEWSLWRDQDAHRFRFSLDMPTKLTSADIAKDFLATHYGGLREGGWTRERFIPYRVEDQFDGLTITIDAIRRVTATLPEAQAQTIGYFKWNSRIALSYVSTNKMLFAVYADSRNDKKMVVLGTNAAGETEPVDDGVFPQLDNIIDSFDAYRFANKQHIVTQERTTGRVAYHVFDMAAQLWDTLNDEVLASNSDGDVGATITVTSVSGEPVVVFMGDREAAGPSFWGTFEIAAAGDYNRSYMSRLIGGSWTTPEMVGSPNDLLATFFPSGVDYAGAVGIRVGRAIAEANDWVRFVYTVDEPADVASNPDVYTQRMNPSGVLLAAEEIKFTSASMYTAAHVVGDPCVFTYGGLNYTAVPIGFIYAPMLFIWVGAGTSGMATHEIYLADPTTLVQTMPDTFGTLNPPISVRFFNNKLQVVMATRVGSENEFAAIKTLDPPFTTLSPDALSNPRDDQVGPTWNAGDYARHGVEFAAIRGHQYLFKVTSGNFGIPGDSAYSILERIDLATDVPGDNAYTLAQWLIDNF